MNCMSIVKGNGCCLKDVAIAKARIRFTATAKISAVAIICLMRRVLDKSSGMVVLLAIPLDTGQAAKSWIIVMKSQNAVTNGLFLYTISGKSDEGSSSKP